MLLYVLRRTISQSLIGYVLLVSGLDYGGIYGTAFAVLGLFFLASAGYTVYHYLEIKGKKLARIVQEAEEEKKHPKPYAYKANKEQKVEAKRAIFAQLSKENKKWMKTLPKYKYNAILSYWFRWIGGQNHVINRKLFFQELRSEAVQKELDNFQSISESAYQDFIERKKRKRQDECEEQMFYDQLRQDAELQDAEFIEQQRQVNEQQRWFQEQQRLFQEQQFRDIENHNWMAEDANRMDEDARMMHENNFGFSSGFDNFGGGFGDGFGGMGF